MTRRKPTKPSPAELEAQANAILRQADRDMLTAIADNVQTLCEGFAALRQPSNDPHYLKTLQDREATRNAIANDIKNVHIVPDGNKTWIALGLCEPWNKATAMRVARQVGEHFEAGVIHHDGPME